MSSRRRRRACSRRRRRRSVAGAAAVPAAAAAGPSQTTAPAAVSSGGESVSANGNGSEIAIAIGIKWFGFTGDFLSGMKSANLPQRIWNCCCPCTRKVYVEMMGEGFLGIFFPEHVDRWIWGHGRNMLRKRDREDTTTVVFLGGRRGNSGRILRLYDLMNGIRIGFCALFWLFCVCYIVVFYSRCDPFDMGCCLRRTMSLSVGRHIP